MERKVYLSGIIGNNLIRGVVNAKMETESGSDKNDLYKSAEIAYMEIQKYCKVNGYMFFQI